MTTTTTTAADLLSSLGSQHLDVELGEVLLYRQALSRVHQHADLLTPA